MEEYIRNRITKLRMTKGVSEYQMSYDLGHSRSYINNISSGKSLPSMSEFLTICDYFEITPRDFFNTDVEDPVVATQLIAELQDLNEEDTAMLLALVKRIKRN